MNIEQIAQSFLDVPLAYVQAKIRRRFGLLPAECDHPVSDWRFDRMICGKCGMTREDMLVQRRAREQRCQGIN